MFPIGQIAPTASSIIYYDDVPATTIAEFYEYVLDNIKDPAPNFCAVSPELPMKSGVGWYVGRCCYNYDASCGQWRYEPYDRTSDYFLTEDDAADHASWARWTFTNKVEKSP